jgi:hypothetical protein
VVRHSAPPGAVASVIRNESTALDKAHSVVERCS